MFSLIYLSRLIQHLLHQRLHHFELFTMFLLRLNEFGLHLPELLTVFFHFFICFLFLFLFEISSLVANVFWVWETAVQNWMDCHHRHWRQEGFVLEACQVGRLRKCTSHFLEIFLLCDSRRLFSRGVYQLLDSKLKWTRFLELRNRVSCYIKIQRWFSLSIHFGRGSFLQTTTHRWGLCSRFRVCWLFRQSWLLRFRLRLTDPGLHLLDRLRAGKLGSSTLLGLEAVVKNRLLYSLQLRVNAIRKGFQITSFGLEIGLRYRDSSHHQSSLDLCWGTTLANLGLFDTADDFLAVKRHGRFLYALRFWVLLAGHCFRYARFFSCVRWSGTRSWPFQRILNFFYWEEVLAFGSRADLKRVILSISCLRAATATLFWLVD